MSSTTIDTTLPESSSPAMDGFEDMPMTLLPFAIYSHVHLSQAELARVLTECNSQLEPSIRNTVRPPPRHDFNGLPLRESFVAHIREVAPSGEFDPFNFVAIVEKDWRKSGLLLVTLDDDEHEWRVDQMCVPAAEVGIVLVNIQIGNVSWDEHKEQYGSDGGDDADDNDAMSSGGKGRKGDDAHGSHTTASGSDPPHKKAQAEDYYSDGAADTLPNIKYWIGLYAVEGVDFETLMRRLDNSPVAGPLSQLITRPEGRVPQGEIAAVKEASSLHPRRCRDNEDLYRTMFLVADKVDYREHGLILVKLEWDGIIQGRSSDELSLYGNAAKTDTQRVPVESHVTTTRFNMLVRGWTPWRSLVWAFLIYGGRRGQNEYSLMDYLDKTSAKRKYGAERFLYGSMEHGLQGSRDMLDFELAHPWRGAVRRHPLQVYRHRFYHTLSRQLFVYCGEELGSAEDLVTLVRMDWDGAVEGKSLEELWNQEDLLDKVTVMQCPAGKAYNMLVQFANAEKSWPGVRPSEGQLA